MNNNDINLLVIVNCCFLILSILLLNIKYILFNIFCIIGLLLYKNYNNDTDNNKIIIDCYLPTSENPYMNYNNDVNKKKACPFYKSKDLIDKYTNFKIFKTIYNQKKNLNFFNNAFYIKPITTYIHNYFPLINWSYKKNDKPFITNNINPTSYLINNNNINIKNKILNILDNNDNNIDNYIKKNNYISNLSNNFIK
tara:strand:- start:612 stop:1199 length:588 start_codon:yes stop_codon:yes gene_type:complete